MEVDVVADVEALDGAGLSTGLLTEGWNVTLRAVAVWWVFVVLVWWGGVSGMTLVVGVGADGAMYVIADAVAEDDVGDAGEGG